MALSVNELSDYLIARLILRRLWQIQDAGGVSVGRSKQSVLLEAALDLMPWPADLDADSFSEQDLMDEATARSGNFLDRPLQLPLFSDLEWQSNEVLIFLLLSHLRQHYLLMAENVETTNDWSFVIETPIMSLAWLLLAPGDDFSPDLMQLPIRNLVELSDERFRQKCRQEEQERFGVY